jgi:adenylosuccinate lyase|tara:strand:+ start:906 stop:2273 length:1368 start_codon:yes stop_codon:yes gene_type:complete
MTSALNALSTIDGRYSAQADNLRPFFSEFGLIKNRVKIEILWLILLGDDDEIKEIPKFSKKTKQQLDLIIQHFSLENAESIKIIEKDTNHDVKAVEYWLKDNLKSNSEIQAVSEFIHFACTSEDINNLSYALMLKEGMEQVIIPSIKMLEKNLSVKAKLYSSIPMLARTHGQTASPTTLGKEFANVSSRISRQIVALATQDYLGKMNGAVGNYNAHYSAYPNKDWHNFSKVFIESLGLKQNAYTTQIEPHDFMAEIFHSIIRVNSILIDLNRDLWSYISNSYFTQKTLKNEVGSSTMPHKVNPIDFENSEGNLGLANALLTHLSEKLPLSRWQRDLTDSTVLRNIGLALGYSLVAYKSCLKGLDKIEVNQEKINIDLDSAWEILAEPIQTVMRKNGISNPYEKLKELTRGSQKINQKILHDFISALEISKEDKEYLINLKPQTYLGIAIHLAKNI